MFNKGCYKVYYIGKISPASLAACLLNRCKQYHSTCSCVPNSLHSQMCDILTGGVYFHIAHCVQLVNTIKMFNEVKWNMKNFRYI